MADSGDHNAPACARVWQMLRIAHDRIAARLTDALQSLGLSLSEFDVLLHLRTHPGDGVRIGTLQESCTLSQPALSRLVTRLSERGLVTRTGSEGDGRAILLSLTEFGKNRADEAIAVHARTVHEALAGQFTAEEQAQLLSALSGISDRRPRD